ncbi:MAG: DNA-binding protein [Pseudomonadota bacterium]
MGKLAEKVGLNRETLYRTLSEQGNPELRSLEAILHAMGLRLSVDVEDRRGVENTWPVLTCYLSSKSSRTHPQYGRDKRLTVRVPPGAQACVMGVRTTQPVTSRFRFARKQPIGDTGRRRW